MAKQKSNLGKSIIKIIMAIPSIFNFIHHLTSLVGMEARLAGRSLIILVMLSIVGGILLAAIWICVLAMFYIYLIAWHWSPLQILALITVLNIVLLFIIGWVMSKFKRNLTFPETRRQLGMDERD